MPDKNLIILALKATSLYLTWYVLYVVWLAPDGKFDTWMNESVAYGGWVLVNALGYDGCHEGTTICVNIVSTVRINSGCNGFEIYCIFAGFIILFATKWWQTAIYILIGVVILYISNIIRVGMLAIDYYKNYNLFIINHKFTYVIIVYTIVFVLWFVWIFKFVKNSHEKV